jgi:hypothetical protein
MRSNSQDLAGDYARQEIFCRGAVIALLALTAVFVLAAAPVFPTQDGPVHLYYVDILRDLLRHAGPYAAHFELKSFFTPYALEYFTLLALEAVFPPALSEKLLICGYIFAFGFGFRYLLASVAERNSPWTLVGIPFCMNALVYKGFLNYSICVALLLFLSGFWIRHGRQLRARRITILLVLLIFMMFTHPVPVAIFLLFIGLHFSADLALATAAGPELWLPSLRERRGPLAMIAVMAVTSAVWVSMFMNHSQRASPAASNAAQHGWVYTVTSALKLWGLSPFNSPAYRGGLLILLAITGLAGLAGVWRHKGRPSSSVIAMSATSAICFALFCFAPFFVNGSGFFNSRFGMPWIVFFVAAIAALHPPPRWSFAAGVIALCVTIALLSSQCRNVSRIAREITPALSAPVAKSGSVGLIVGEKNSHPDWAFDPFLWSGVHYFRRSKAILANMPWTNLPIIMIRPVPPDRWSYLDPSPAGSSFWAALNERDPVPELSFLVVDGSSDLVMEDVMTGAHWVPLPQSSSEIRIFARRQ